MAGLQANEACSENPQETLPGWEGPGGHLIPPSHFGDRETEAQGAEGSAQGHLVGSGQMYACTPGVLSPVGLFLL